MIITAKLKDGIHFLCLTILSLSGWATMESVGVSCTLNILTPGVLKREATLKAVSSTYTDGSVGSVAVTCSVASSLTVGAPILVNAPETFAPTVLQAVVQRGSSTAFTDYTSSSSGSRFANSGLWASSTAPLVLRTGASTLYVNMVAGTNAPGVLPSGLYSYSVKLTVTPN